MRKSNSIKLALKFYRNHSSGMRLENLLALVAFSGILETLPILASLPLLRAIFLGHEMISLGAFESGLVSYTIGLGVLLLLRFFIGRWAQYSNASERIALLTTFRKETSEEERQGQKVNYGKSVQAINFLLVGWSQFIPGLLFTLLGLYLSPKFGVITLVIIATWMLVISKIKQQQDFWHAKGSELAKDIDTLNTIELDELHSNRLKAAKWDATNKNLRELVIISSLIVSLIINNYLGMSPSFDSILIVIVFLRGLQQLFTAYIMSQQLSGLTNFLEKV
jgi:hypothetical protein